MVCYRLVCPVSDDSLWGSRQQGGCVRIEDSNTTRGQHDDFHRMTSVHHYISAIY